MKKGLHRSGFTLLEVVLAIALTGLIVGMIVGVARTSMSLGKTIVESQAEEMKRQALVDFLKMSFSSLPGNAQLELKVEDSGQQCLSELTLQNVPMSFTWGGQDRIAKAVQLVTVKRGRSGTLDLVMRYYEDEIIVNPSMPVNPSADKVEPFAEILLTDNLAYFEWRVLDSRTMEWGYDWINMGRLPLQMELRMAEGVQGQEERNVFWLPVKISPEVWARQYLQGATGSGNPAGGSGGGGQNPGGGLPGGPTITIPGNGMPRGQNGGGR